MTVKTQAVPKAMTEHLDDQVTCADTCHLLLVNKLMQAAPHRQG